MAETTQIVIEGKVTGASSYKELKKEVRGLAEDVKTLALEGKKETQGYKDKEARLKALQGSLKAVDKDVRDLTKSTSMSSAQFLNFGKNIAIISIGIGKAMSVLKDAIGSVTGSMTKYVEESTLLAARNEVLGVVVEQVGKTAGYTATQMTDYVESIKKLGITTSAARQTVIDMTKNNLDLAASTKLARLSQDAAVISNTNSSEALKEIIYGVTTYNTKVLRTQGLLVNFNTAFDNHAKVLGKSKDELTEVERQQASLNAVLEAGAQITGSYEAAMETAGKQFTSLPRYFEEISAKVGEVFLPAFGEAVKAITNLSKWFLSLDANMTKAIVVFGLTATAVLTAAAIIIPAILAVAAAFVTLGGTVAFATAGISVIAGLLATGFAVALAGVAGTLAYFISDIIRWWQSSVKVQGALQALEYQVNTLWKAVNSLFASVKIGTGAWDFLKKVLEKFATTTAISVITAIRGIAWALEFAVRAIKGFIQNMEKLFDLFTKGLGKMGEFVDGLFGLSDALSQPAPDTFFASIVSAVDWAIGKVKEFIGWLKQLPGMSGIFPDALIINIPKKDPKDKIDPFFDPDRDKPPGKTGKGSKGKTEKEKDALDELLKSVKENILNAELNYKLSLNILSTELQRLKAANSLADTTEKMNKLLGAQRDIEKQQWELRSKGIDKLNTSKFDDKPLSYADRNPQLLTERQGVTRGSSDFGVIAMLMSDAFGEAKDDINLTLDAIKDITGILGEGVSNFVSSLIDGFNSVLNLVGGIISLLNQLGSGGGIISGLLSLAGVLAAPFTGGASLAVTAAAGAGGYAMGTDSASSGLHWVGEKGPELRSFRGGETVLSNANIQKMHSMLTATNRPSNNISQNFEFKLDRDGMFKLFEGGKRITGKMYKVSFG